MGRGNQNPKPKPKPSSPAQGSQDSNADAGPITGSPPESDAPESAPVQSSKQNDFSNHPKFNKFKKESK